MTCAEKQGTLAGMSRHRRNWETPCDECKAAAAAWARSKRNTNPELRERGRRDNNRRREAIRRLIMRHRSEYAELLRQVNA